MKPGDERPADGLVLPLKFITQVLKVHATVEGEVGFQNSPESVSNS